MAADINNMDIPELSLDDMSRILDNVYASCDMEPVQVPLESVVAYTKYRQERFSIQKTIALVAFVLFLLVPFLFIPPRFSVTEVEASESDPKKIFAVEITSKAPIRSVTAEMNGYSVPVYEKSEHSFQIQPMENGSMTVTVTLFNGQKNQYTCEVEGVDNTAPVLISNDNDDKYLYLYVDDGEGLGIDYENTYGVTSDGHHIQLYSYDPEKGEIVFEYPKENINVIIPDTAGNILQLVVSQPD